MTEYRESNISSAILVSNRGRLAAQRYSCIIRNVVRQLPGGDFGGLAVIALAQVRHHGTPHISRPRIIDHRLEPVAHFDAVFALVGSDEQQHPAIVFLASHSKLFEEVYGIVLDAFAFKRLDSHNRHLRASLLLQLGA